MIAAIQGEQDPGLLQFVVVFLLQKLQPIIIIYAVQVHVALYVHVFRF